MHHNNNKQSIEQCLLKNICKSLPDNLSIERAALSTGAKILIDMHLATQHRNRCLKLGSRKMKPRKTIAVLPNFPGTLPNFLSLGISQTCIGIHTIAIYL